MASDVPAKILAAEQAADEVYAVFLHEGRAWEERVRHYVSYRTLHAEGRLQSRVVRHSSLSALSDEGLPNAERPGFVGLRPVAMPRKRFAEVIGMAELEAARYVAQCSEKDDWALAEIDPEDGG